MAAYTALVSLMNTLCNIQIHPQVSAFVDQKQIESLRIKIRLLLDFVEKFKFRGGNREREDLEIQISSAAASAENVIESQIVDRIEYRSTETSFCFPIDLQKIIEDLDSLMEKGKMMIEERRLVHQQPTYSNPIAKSRSPLAIGKTTMVGFDGYLMQLLDRLTGQESNRQIIPIVGMGGIGKTTLAKNAYENLLIVEKFDVRAWITVSQEYSVRDILLQILSCFGGFANQDDKIGEKLYKTLFDRRYLVILDDMWSIEAWLKIQSFFPENFNGSRIVVTTRQSDVSSHFGSLALALDFLDNYTSWDLFCDKAFAQEGCPPDLEEIGKKIVKKCRGLPLAIVVVGGLLSKSSKTHEYWEMVERDLSSILSSEENNLCFNVLSLSYNHLPPHLKPCFLNLGAYKEDHAIKVSEFIKLWVAEGFLLPNKLNTEQSLEEIAESYVKDLVDRNLILVRGLSRRGKVKTVSIHDLLRDLCIKVAKKEKFFRVKRELEDMDSERRIMIHESIDRGRVGVSLKSSRIMIGLGDCGFVVKPRLRRVVLVAWGSLYIPFQHVNLLVFRLHNDLFNRELPCTISLLWNLQTIILPSCDVVAPVEVWEMQQLRHFQCSSIFLPDPPTINKRNWQNLMTLKLVRDFSCSMEVYSRMPNIKKLRISYYGKSKKGTSFYCHYNFACLNKLESLRFYCDSFSNRYDLLHNLTFPSSLKKLTLGRCKLHWDDLSPMIGSLPHLEAFILEHSLQGGVWNPAEGGFPSLKCLSFCEAVELFAWKADKYCFPVLEKLFISQTYMLEIPIGEIDTLKNISLIGCEVSMAVSALRMLEEQECLGNEDIRVEVHLRHRMYLQEFRTQVELQGLVFPRPNFHMLL